MVFRCVQERSNVSLCWFCYGLLRCRDLFGAYIMLVILKAHNKRLLAQATPAGAAYRVVRSKAGR